MANFMQTNSVVKYACSCGILNPISKLFFCRHCLKLVCGYCVCHEIDSHFCSNCLENIPSSEARHKKNCCANCFDCPCCGHTLSARATTVAIKKPAEEPAKEGEGEGARILTKKMYYLSCLACRWTSRDVGIPDQSVATGSWPDNECSYQTRFNALLEYYQALVLQEKQEKQEYLRRKTPKTHKFPSLTDRTGLTVSMIRRQIGWSDKSTQKIKPAQITPAAATSDVDELPDYIFTKPINLKNVTTIKQRHAQPIDQPFTVNKLHPQRRCLWIKRSLRCRQCEHNVIKPEYHPTSVKYRIQLFANYHVPEVLLVRCEQSLKAGQACTLIMKVMNPTIHDMRICIKYLPTLEEELQLIEQFKSNCNLKDAALASLTASESLKNKTSGTAAVSFSRQTSVNEEPRLVQQKSNCALELPSKSFVLSPRDDSMEFDDDEQTKSEELDFITWRKGNKVAVRLKFTPNAELQTAAAVTLGFSLQYSYINTVSNTPEKKEPTEHELNCRIFMNLGKIET